MSPANTVTTPAGLLAPVARSTVPVAPNENVPPAEVPKALASALRDGNMGVMDYFNLKNVQADTDMRRSLGGGTADGDQPDS